MTLNFTEEEKKWLIVDLSLPYSLKSEENAPKSIKESIDRKIKEHKKWLDTIKGGGGNEPN